MGCFFWSGTPIFDLPVGNITVDFGGHFGIFGGKKWYFFDFFRIFVSF